MFTIKKNMDTIAANNPNTEIGILNSASDIGNNLKKGDLFETIFNIDFGGPSIQTLWIPIKFEGRVANLYHYSIAKLVSTTDAYKSIHASNKQLLPLHILSETEYLPNSAISPIGTHTNETSKFV